MARELKIRCNLKWPEVDFSLNLQTSSTKMLSSLGKSKNSLFNVHLALFVRRMT